MAHLEKQPNCDLFVVHLVAASVGLVFFGDAGAQMQIDANSIQGHPCLRAEASSTRRTARYHKRRNKS